MECPKCQKGTCVLVTTQNKTRVKERHGLLYYAFAILLFPIWLVWRLLFGRKKETYYKEMNWNCRYCGHKFPDKPQG